MDNGHPKTERRATFNVGTPNGKHVGWGTAIVGIPAAALASWLLQAGEIKKEVSTNSAKIAEVKVEARVHEGIESHPGVVKLIDESESKTNKLVEDAEARCNRQIDKIQQTHDMLERKMNEVQADSSKQFAEIRKQQREDFRQLINAINNRNGGGGQ